MRLALDTPLPADKVSFAGPGKSVAELTQAVAAGVVVEVESPLEVDRITAAGEELGIRPVVALRLNPDFEVKGSGMRMGGGAQQFGVDVEEAPRLLKEMEARGLDLRGFHVFAGSQNLHADILVEAQRRTVDLVLRMADEMAAEPTYVNLGGGFGIPYYDKDRAAGPGRGRRRPRGPGAYAPATAAARGAGAARARPLHRGRGGRSTSRASSTARSPAAPPSSSSTAGCTTSSPRPATSAR